MMNLVARSVQLARLVEILVLPKLIHAPKERDVLATGKKSE